MKSEVLPELHADIEVVKEVPSKRHAILRGENSMDPACRGRKNTCFVMHRCSANCNNGMIHRDSKTEL